MTQLSAINFAKSLTLDNTLAVSDREGDFLSVFSETKYATYKKKSSEEDEPHDEQIPTTASHLQSLQAKEAQKKELSEGFEGCFLEGAWFASSLKEEAKLSIEASQEASSSILAATAPAMPLNKTFAEGKSLSNETLETGIEAKGDDQKTNRNELLLAALHKPLQGNQQGLRLLSKKEESTQALDDNDLSQAKTALSLDALAVDIPSSLREGSEASMEEKAFTKAFPLAKDEASRPGLFLQNEKAQGISDVSKSFSVDTPSRASEESVLAPEASDVPVLAAAEGGEAFQKQTKLLLPARSLGLYASSSGSLKAADAKIFDAIAAKRASLLEAKHSENIPAIKPYEEPSLGLGLNPKNLGIYKIDTDKKEYKDSSYGPPAISEVSFLAGLGNTAMNAMDVQEPLGAEKLQADIVGLIADYFDKIKEEGRSWTRLSLGSGTDKKINLYIRMQGKTIGIRLQDAPDGIDQALLKGWPQLSKIAAHKGLHLNALEVSNPKIHAAPNKSSQSKLQASHLNTIV
jgi:hypothetical protein